MTARQKLMIMLGLGLFAAAWLFDKLSKTGALEMSQPLTPSLPGPSDDNSVAVTVRRIWDAIPSTPWAALLQSVESSLGIPATLLTRMAWIESRFNPGAYNAKSGATGIMQIVPAVHAGVDAKNPQAAIPYAGNFLKQLYNQFGDWEKAIAAYNWGPGNLQKDIAKNGANWKAGLPAETANYIAQVNAVIDLPA